MVITSDFFFRLSVKIANASNKRGAAPIIPFIINPNPILIALIFCAFLSLIANNQAYYQQIRYEAKQHAAFFFREIM